MKWNRTNRVLDKIIDTMEQEKIVVNEALKIEDWNTVNVYQKKAFSSAKAGKKILHLKNKRRWILKKN